MMSSSSPKNPIMLSKPTRPPLEYLAAGIRVVSSDLPDVASLSRELGSDLVWIYDDHATPIEGIRELIRMEPVSEDVRSAIYERYSWDRLVREWVAHVEEEMNSRVAKGFREGHTPNDEVVAAAALGGVAFLVAFGLPRTAVFVALALGMLQYGPTKTLHLFPPSFTVLDDILLLALGLRWLVDVAFGRTAPPAWVTMWLLVWMAIGLLSAVGHGISVMTTLQ